jgi:ParB family chromosome partitioning protein
MPDTKIALESLIPYSKHLFALYEGRRMEDMIASIREHGIITPIVVRPVSGKKIEKIEEYEILSGHNRVEAARALGLNDVPAVIKEDLSDEEAELIVTETNLIQRSFADLKHSERAIVLKNHLESLKKLNEKNDKNEKNKREDFFGLFDDDQGAQVAHPKKSRDKVAKQYALSKDTVMRYVRLANLPKDLLDKLDDEELKFTPAVELSWLSPNELDIVSDLLKEDGVKVSLKKKKKIREESKECGGTLGSKDIQEILCEITASKNLRNISISDDLSKRLAAYSTDPENSDKADNTGKIVEDIVSLYLDMLERGEVKDVFGLENTAK